MARKDSTLHAFDLRKWTFRCFGLVEKEVSWSWPEFQKLPRVTVVSDIH
jgi:DMSO/TMAO reductase YedYZ molybdopterin-dependent catalytic subunit